MATDPLLGKTFGNVRITQRLGAGAMGMVYRGTHAGIGREVAVKFLGPNQRGNAKERFLREGRSAARIRHEHVVQVLDAGDQDGTAYLVMELVNGHSIGDILDDKGALDPEIAARLGAQTALGLAAIHAAGVVHRDIKPDNVLVGEDLKAKITDLGLAKQLDEPELQRLTGSGMVVGTPLYLAPEGVRDPQSIGPKSDVYSLGAMLYHMLTGKPPFSGNTPYEVMRGHLEEKPQAVREVKPEVPPGLAALVERCLSKVPEKRPTALELADLLGQGASLRLAASRGVALVVGLAIAGVLGLAGGTWALLHRGGAGGAENPAARQDCTLRIRTVRSDVVARVDHGLWSPMPETGLVVGPGRRTIEVRTAANGPARWWRKDLDLRPGQSEDISASLEPVRLATPARESMPGEGMLFRDGSAFGTEMAVAFSEAGTYAVGRWDGSVFRSRTIAVDTDGSTQASPLQEGDRPNGPAWFRDRDEDGRSIPRHHVLCWWEVEQGRSTARIPESAGWRAQGAQPEQPALELTPALVQAALDRLPPGTARLPGHSEAARLAAIHRSPFWYQESGRLDVIDGAARTSLLAVVPVER